MTADRGSREAQLLEAVPDTCSACGSIRPKDTGSDPWFLLCKPEKGGGVRISFESMKIVCPECAVKITEKNP